MSYDLTISDIIKQRIRADNKQYRACDNISEYIHNESEKKELIREVEQKFSDVLSSLIIDIENDPNSENTPKRLAKMYINELMSGRYDPPPKTTVFPNVDKNGTQKKYSGMIVVRADIKSMCSHHHQPVNGVAYIGVIPVDKVIGLSKYVRIAQWCARRGTLQEELTNHIADEIIRVTGADNVGVHINARHGCMENRGVCAHSSTTQTTVLHGMFWNADVKKEFYDSIKMSAEKFND